MAERDPGPAARRPLPVWAVLGFALLCLVLAGWVHDDAYISFRVVDNWLAGHGLRWNVVERVQVYTHPLWLLATAAATPLCGDPAVAATVLALLASLVTFWLLVRRLAATVLVGQVLVLVLLAGKGFVDFAVSGLEDPLTRLLVVVFALEVLRPRHPDDDDAGPRPGRAALWGGLVTLSRPDAFLVVAPALLDLGRRAPRNLVRIALGLAPLAAWGAFALVYYGTPFPNTAYAKLGTGVPRLDRVEQGLVYLADSLCREPVALAAIAVATAIALRRGRAAERALAVGAVAYLAYVVWIGGDYMTGRLVALPFVVAVALLAHRPPQPARPWPAWVAAAVAVVLVPRLVAPLLGDGFAFPGVEDQRRLLHPYTGLLRPLGGEAWPDHSYRYEGEAAARRPPAVTVSGGIGMLGYFAGPKLTIIDVFALTDPLLARLPAVVEVGADGDVAFRPGHLRRPLPAGYREAIVHGPSRLADPDLERYYAALWSITRDPLWSRRRLRLVVNLHLGRLDASRDAWVARHRELFVTGPGATLTGTRSAPSPPPPRATP